MTGLDLTRVNESRKQHGSNSMELHEERVLLNVIREIVLEPMFILLVAACTIYFLTGSYQEGIIMLVAIFLVSGISLFQEYRSRRAVQALKKLSQSHAKLIREDQEVEVPIEEVVVDDVLLLKEGEIIAADGLVEDAHDFSVNESILTGESFPAFKNGQAQVYRGTLVTSGSARVLVNAVGLKTWYGRIGLALRDLSVARTPLQQQIRSFVRYMVRFGAVAFIIVIGFNYARSGNLLHSFLQGLTLAMSILPEEIPVAFSTFQALGAFRLLREKIIVKQPQYVETLGAATVICADKTGTLTQNRMRIASIYDAYTKQILSPEDPHLPAGLIEYAMWSSETDPFDPMEKALHALYGRTAQHDKRPHFKQIHEYPVGGNPPIMTHIFRNDAGETIIAAKGAPEGFKDTNDALAEQARSYARQGYRVLGVAQGNWQGPKDQWPRTQNEFGFRLLGLIAFDDPPKENIRTTLSEFRAAGIDVKMITGDHPETALAIAGEVGLEVDGKVLSGTEVMNMDDAELRQCVKATGVFARMFPEAKLKVINALRENGEVVAMTGDGVNDGPALKAAHIGIAMGKRGSEVAKGAAALILADDDLAHMTAAIALGRKIYDNLKKAVQYIISIHIPIILIVMLPLLLDWSFTEIFTPVHVIFLELIMGPTCSIIYENEPMEKGTMWRPPRKMVSTFLSLKQLTLSIVQGLIITLGCLGYGYYGLQKGFDEETVRTMIFVTLLFSNIFLTLVNRSFYYSVFTTLSYRNILIPIVVFATLAFTVALLLVPFLQDLFALAPLNRAQLLGAIVMAAVSTLWLEFHKLRTRLRRS